MSAYKVFSNVQFTNGEVLVQTLQQLGFAVEIGANVTLHGFGRQQRSVQIAIRANPKAGFWYDWGFAWNGRAFELIMEDASARRMLESSWDGSKIVHPAQGATFPEQLKVMYSKVAVLQFLQGKNANVLSCASGQNGTIIQATVEV